MGMIVDMSNTKKFEQIKCVTFDLDDTLWPVGPAIINAELKLYQWIEEHYPLVTDAYTQQDITAKRKIFQESHADIVHDVTEIRYRSLIELANEFGYDKAFAQQAIKLFRFHRNQIEPFEFSISILSSLKQHFVIGAITNGNAQVEHTSIGKYFDFVVTAEEVGVSKPHSEMFVRASSLANIDLANILHVGDSVKTDVLGAMNAGCQAVWYNSQRQPWPGDQNPQHVIHCLTELPAILNINNDN